ncbi:MULTISPECIES: polysaccharide pyruvyl transferase family protein [Shewanella]|uniref:polysaccharide pyruvyl transferase family protein n=1 Tax=Shewanella TaxID=22 RepID=UPI000C3273B1|nr:polysaccharide pyruvyl transferase family protein [Shewanella algae]MBO2640741.1 polysaccharide pyruvyl transferase family protein [Shewanella algae]
MKKLVVEVKGIGFPNKGAELMLAAIIEQFNRRGIEAIFAVEPYGDYALRSKFGLYQIARVKKFGIDVGKIVGLLPKKLLHVFGIISTMDVDVIIDASGFSYGDQWGPDLIEYRLGSTIKKLKNKGKKVYLLPQALGPFKDDLTRNVSAKIFNYADKVFARDPISLKYASDIAKDVNIGLCSDFTNLIKGHEYSEFDFLKHQTCFIPNSKMLEKTGDGEHYIEMMVKLLKESYVKDKKPFIVIHEGEKDRLLAVEMVRRTGIEIPILEPIDPLKIKWVVGNSHVVISSRFHGLVSALSQGIPVIATGWSHKYRCLLQDYNVDEALFDVIKDHDKALDYFIKLVSDDEYYDAVTVRIKDCSDNLKLEVNKMWDQVFNDMQTLIK